MQDTNTNLDTTTPARLTPRHYQVGGIQYLTTPRVRLNADDLQSTLCRAILTDAPGSGKTFQASEAAKCLINRQSQLTPTVRRSVCVIAPAHLVDQWFRFLCFQYPDDHVVSIEGTTKYKDLANPDHIDWLILSVQSMRRQDFCDAVSQSFIANHTFVCIIDESHYVKNADAKQSHNVRLLTRPEFVPHCFLLSATPITREADDLWHQLRIVDPITFRSQDRFLNTYCWFTMGSYGPSNVSFRKGATDLLQGKTTTNIYNQSQQAENDGLGWMMGRSYADIGLELPPIIPPAGSPAAIVKQSLQPKLRKAYDDIKAYWYHATFIDKERATLSGDNAMEIMHLLRHITNAPEKRQRLINHLETDPGPYLVGCFYRQSAKDLAQDIEAAGYTPHVITGEVPADDRVRIAQRAGKTSNKDVIIATIPSISEGCDLSHLNTVLFYEEDYTPGKMYQFMSRVRRHRNTDDPAHTEFTIDSSPNEQGTFSITLPASNPNSTPVICRYIHAAGTIDERIHAVQSNRAVSVKDLIKVELQS